MYIVPYILWYMYYTHVHIHVGSMLKGCVGGTHVGEKLKILF